MTEIFNTLNNVNVNEHTKKKNSLTYLSWAWAWGKLKEFYPDANYTVYCNSQNEMPYFTDGKTCTVKVGVTVEGLEHIEFLPVMDYRNKSIPYEEVTSFDVNKAVQRCLTKAIALHGLGLYIYEGEDLPKEETKAKAKAKAETMSNSKEPVPYVPQPKVCEECGQVITATVDKKGNEISASQVANTTKKKYGRCLCSECAKAVSGK